MNYFDIVVLLYYIENDFEYNNIKKYIQEKITDKCKTINSKDIKDTELLLLIMDTLSCPFLDINFKREIASFIYKNKDDCSNIINFSLKQKNWFVEWKNIDILKKT
ncbi:hypothetical protein LS81_007710 [Helicobacter trogontum]|uniref:Uncharacterized protein n=1 Tax=Helicobacter trogontum TaxID=50960 RepID=A0A4U8S9B9_9HELI|nr:hypothetical protein [Helicobacter trogontum]TLD82541.1 hypothetical protein LS81_007710 [Helicobacter trogontum]